MFLQKTMKFEASTEVERLKKASQLRKKKRYSRSKIDRYKHEIRALRREGATLDECLIWLREKRVVVHKSTLSRWLTKDAALQ